MYFLGTCEAGSLSTVAKMVSGPSRELNEE